MIVDPFKLHTENHSNLCTHLLKKLNFIYSHRGYSYTGYHDLCSSNIAFEYHSSLKSSGFAKNLANELNKFANQEYIDADKEYILCHPQYNKFKNSSFYLELKSELIYLFDTKPELLGGSFYDFQRIEVTHYQAQLKDNIFLCTSDYSRYTDHGTLYHFSATENYRNLDMLEYACLAVALCEDFPSHFYLKFTLVRYTRGAMEFVLTPFYIPPKLPPKKDNGPVTKDIY